MQDPYLSEILAQFLGLDNKVRGKETPPDRRMLSAVKTEPPGTPPFVPSLGRYTQVCYAVITAAVHSEGSVTFPGCARRPQTHSVPTHLQLSNAPC